MNIIQRFRSKDPKPLQVDIDNRAREYSISWQIDDGLKGFDNYKYGRIYSYTDISPEILTLQTAKFEDVLI